MNAISAGGRNQASGREPPHAAQEGPGERGNEICFSTADSRPEVATIVFRALDHEAGLHFVHPEFELNLDAEADAVMETLAASAAPRAAPSAAIPATTTQQANANRSSMRPAIIIAIALTAAIAAFVALHRRKRSKKKRAPPPATRRSEPAWSV